MELTDQERQLIAEYAKRGIHLEPLNEQERQQDAAYEWVLHDAEVQRTFAGKVVAAHGRRVIGVGKNHWEAFQDALRQPDCPPRQEIAVVYVEGHPLDAR
jgi:hypothetical protein